MNRLHKSMHVKSDDRVLTLGVQGPRANDAEVKIWSHTLIVLPRASVSDGIPWDFSIRFTSALMPPMTITRIHTRPKSLQPDSSCQSPLHASRSDLLQAGFT